MKTRLPHLSVCCFIVPILFVLSSISAHAQPPAFWGMTVEGGTSNAGTIFKMTPDGTGHAVQYSFAIENPGARPFFGSQLLQLANGKMYGVTESGGLYQRGVLYEYNPATNAYTKLHDFDQATGENPTGGLALAPNGKLYGMAQAGGSANQGVLFEFDLTTNTYTKKVDFTGTNGSLPFACTLYLHTNGKFYGVTFQGGTSGLGVLFEYDPATNTYAKKIDFAGTTNGRFPYTSLMMSSTGRVFGATSQGGTNDNGTLYEYNPTTNTLTKRRDFTTADGRFPLAALVEADNGRLYGLAGSGGANAQGTLYEFNLATNTFAKKIDFNGTNGHTPYPGFVKAANGNLYGMTNGGGTSSVGVIFEYNVTANTLTKKLDFFSDPTTGKSPNGRVPTSNFTLASNGLLYGTLSQGGSTGDGVIFEYNSSTNAFTKKIDFNARPNGGFPLGGLVRASNGKFYGMTQIGGANDEGALFEFNSNGSVYTKHYDFSETSGNYPLGSLAAAPNGKLYGMAANGGSLDYGTLFEFDPANNTFTKKIDFDNTNGRDPQGSLLLASNNKFYGMTNSGGTLGDGVIFEYDPATNILTKKIDFDYNTGSEPYGDLIQATNGKLYGLTRDGGDNGNAQGVLFEYDITTNTMTPRVNFFGLNGESPEGNLVQAPNGKLYGMTTIGGTSSSGVLFEFDPTTNSYTKKLDFGGANFGSEPSGGLAVSPNGKLYGGTNFGGANGRGVLFEYDPATSTFTKKLDFNGTNGAHIVYQRFLFVKGEQTISFAALADKTIGDAAFAISATSSVELPVSFSTSTPTKVSIANGQVTLLSAGRANITATQVGNGSYNAASVERNFCINPAKPIITTSNLNTEAPTLTSSAASGNQWYRNDVLMSGATNSTLIATQEGVYKVQVTVDNCTSEFSTEQVLVITSAETDLESAVSVHPNPVADWLTVSLGELPGTKEVSIVDLTGKKLDSKLELGKEARFNVATYRAGMYLVQVKSEQSTTTKRFVKK